MFADWLEESGEEDRAAFIRTQFELAALKPPRRIRANSLHTDVAGGPVQFSCSDEDAPGVGDTVDIEIATSRVSANQFTDILVVGQVHTTHGPAWLCRQAEGWTHRNRYQDLLSLQYKLLWTQAVGIKASETRCGISFCNWINWAWIYGRDEDGDVVGPDGRPGMTISPAYHDQFPYVEVPPQARQTFRKGFVESVSMPLKHVGLLKDIVRQQPVQVAAIKDRSARTYDALFGQYLWAIAEDAHMLNGHPHMLPDWLFKLLRGEDCTWWGSPVKVYENQLEADKDLSLALISWAWSDDA